MWSDPAKADTDGDGTVDSSDLNPLLCSFVPYLDILCEYAQNYCANNNLQNKDDEITLVLEFLRSTKYVGAKWDIAAGYINKDFIIYVKNNNIDVYNYFLGDDNAVEELYDPLTKEKYDLKILATSYIRPPMGLFSAGCVYSSSTCGLLTENMIYGFANAFCDYYFDLAD